MGSRLKKLIQAIQKAARVSCDRKWKGAVEDEDASLAIGRMKRLEDAGETVVSR